MTEYLVICLTALFLSFFSLFSGFGLGSVLMPVSALFFPLPLAITLTACIHFLNNIFKFFLIGKYADWRLSVRFGIPAAIASAIGAYLLHLFSIFPPLFSYMIACYHFHVTFTGLLLGVIVLCMTCTELFFTSSPSFRKPYLILGGALSGFLGGLSGYQGILRAACLMKARLNAEQFMGTSVVCSLLVDIARLSVYGLSHYIQALDEMVFDLGRLIVIASLSAFLGTYIGSKLMKRVTVHVLKIFVGSILLILGIAMICGFLDISTDIEPFYDRYRGCLACRSAPIKINPHSLVS